jgi:hypothetical protein
MMVLFTPKHVVTCYYTTNNIYIVISILYVIIWNLRCVGYMASIGGLAVNNKLEWM